MIKPHPRFKPKSRIRRAARYTAIGLIGAALGGFATHSGIKIAESVHRQNFSQVSRRERDYSKEISQLPAHEIERLREQALPGGKPLPPNRTIEGILLEKSSNRFFKAFNDFYNKKQFLNKLSNVLLPSISLAGFLSLYFLSKRRRRISQTIRNMRQRTSKRISPKGKDQLVLNRREVYDIFYSEGLEKLLGDFKRAKRPTDQVRILSEIETILQKSPSAQQFANGYKYFYADDAGYLIFTNR